MDLPEPTLRTAALREVSSTHARSLHSLGPVTLDPPASGPLDTDRESLGEAVPELWEEALMLVLWPCHSRFLSPTEKCPIS